MYVMCVYVYVCMYVCMLCVCMYVCTYVGLENKCVQRFGGKIYCNTITWKRSRE